MAAILSTWRDASWQRQIACEVLTVDGIETSVVDAATIAALQEDASLFRELRDLFADEAVEQLQRMLDGRRHGDLKTVGQAAHRLKGTAGTFGAQQMQRLCIEIEGVVRGGALDGADHMIEELSVECDRVKLALDEAADHLV
jgi:HPt (histidine-containing phosphotransfer) domain-containing protein